MEFTRFEALRGYRRCMFVALLAAVVVAAFGLLRGGSLEPLAATQFKWTPLLIAGLVLQILFDFFLPDSVGEGGALAVVLISNAAVVGFLVANRHLPGMILAGVGLILNVVVITANGAMPVSTTAAEIAGISERAIDAGIKHERLTDDTTLPILADVIPIPASRQLISLGDVVLAFGISQLVYGRVLAQKRGRHSADRQSEERTVT